MQVRTCLVLDEVGVFVRVDGVGVWGKVLGYGKQRVEGAVQGYQRFLYIPGERHFLHAFLDLGYLLNPLGVVVVLLEAFVIRIEFLSVGTLCPLPINSVMVSPQKL